MNDTNNNKIGILGIGLEKAMKQDIHNYTLHQHHSGIMHCNMKDAKLGLMQGIIVIILVSLFLAPIFETDPLI